MLKEEEFLELTHNAIIYISSGFDGPFTLQVLTFMKLNPGQYNLCLTDGTLYIGATYLGKLPRQLRPYSVISVQCKFISKWMPMVIKSLQMISNEPSHLLGDAPMTLHDYFLDKHSDNQQYKKRPGKIFFSSQIAEEKPRKIFKKTEQQTNDFHIDDITQKKFVSEGSEISVIQTQKCIPNKGSITEIINKNLEKVSSQKKLEKVSSQKKQSANKKIQLLDVQQTKNIPRVFKGTEDDPISKKPNELMYNSFLEDLYERMPRWKILCRINYIRKFISAKGKKCLTLQIIDEKGTQKKAMYYYGSKGVNEDENQILNLNKVYSLSNGEIIQPSGQTKLPLEIIFNSQSEIKQQPGVNISPFSINKLIKISFLQALEHQSEVTVLGIIKNIEVSNLQKSHISTQDQSNKIRVKGIICHPKQSNQVEFIKNCFSNDILPQSGTICILKNFKINKTSSAVKLNGNNHVNRSYFTLVTQEDLKFSEGKSSKESLVLSQLIHYLTKQSEKQSVQLWKTYSYYDISQVRYKRRNIKEMLQILQKTDSSLLSEVLCSISQIKVKRNYMGCPLCKRATHQNQAYLWHCIKCSTMVEPVPTLILSVTLSDSTGSLPIQIIGEKAEIFLDMTAKEYSKLSEQEKQCHMQMARYESFIIKIRSEYKKFGQINHFPQQILKQQHSTGLDQIRRRTVDKRLRNQIKWQNNSQSIKFESIY